MKFEIKDLPEEKQTELGLYVTAKDAFESWKADPTGIKILDVRTPEEYLFVGHAEMARNIPLTFVTHQWNADKSGPAFAANADFVAAVTSHYNTDDKILVTCRSGGRSKMAIGALTAAGFTNLYNIVDGMEGDKETDPTSSFVGQRMKNGWKNSGAPWTYDIDPDLFWVE